MKMLRRCDCLAGLSRVSPDTVDLAYLDPPFFTGRRQQDTTRSGEKSYAFDDRWNSKEEYEEFLVARVNEIRRVLKPTGSLFFHCDHNATHLARTVLDQVMGATFFQSEIIWTYKRWSNAKKGLLQQHQTILFYSKTADFKWRQQSGAYSPTTNVDQLLQQRQRDKRGKAVYKRDPDGGTVAARAKTGVPLGDVWDLPLLNPKARERVGYPTQKPLHLLDRIVTLTTDVGDCVLDPFAGSGTTLVSAATLGRSYIGFDISADAVALARARLATPIRSASLLLEKGSEAYIKQSDWVDHHLAGFVCDRVQRNAGIDAIAREKLNDMTVCLRVQRADEALVDALAAGQKAMQKRTGCMLALIQTAEGSINAIGPKLLVLPSPALQLERRQRESELLRERCRLAG